MQALAPDVLLCDALLYGQMIAALSRNISCYRVSTGLPDARAPGVPPLTTGLPYGDTPERRLAAEQAWHAFLSQVSAGDEEYFELDRRILDKYGVELIGAKLPAIQKAEDRAEFKEDMERIGLDLPKSGYAHSLHEAQRIVEEVGFPAIIRPSFTMGGRGRSERWDDGYRHSAPPRN